MSACVDGTQATLSKHEKKHFLVFLGNFWAVTVLWTASPQCCVAFSSLVFAVPMRLGRKLAVGTETAAECVFCV